MLVREVYFFKLNPSAKTMLFLLLSAMMALHTLALMEIQVPDQPMVALYGRDTMLNCTFSAESPYNLSDVSVFWQLTDTKRSVHGFSNGQDQLEDQAARFANRTYLSPQRLLQGSASLLLRDVVVADEGSYTCFVKVQDYGSAAFFLQVAAPYSQPVVTLEPNFNHRPGDEVALTCVAYGGYPQAKVVWRNEGGHNLTENITTSHVANEKGLFSLTSVLTVVLEPSSTYSCQLINPLLGEEGKAFVSISGERDTINLLYYKQLSSPSVRTVPFTVMGK